MIRSVFYWFILCLLTGAYAKCDSLSSTCTAEIGKPLENGEFFEISPRTRLFFSLQVILFALVDVL